MNRTRPFSRLTLLAAVVLTGPVWAGPAVAAAAAEPPVPALDRAAAEAIDVAIIAADKGWTLAATRRRMTDQDTFGALQVKIEAQFPTTFAGAEFAEVPGGRSYLRFTGTVPAAARTLAAATGLDVQLTGGRRFSAVQLGTRSVAVVQHLVNAGHRPVSAEVLPSGVVAVTASGAATPASTLPPALREGVTVTFAQQPVVGELSGYGGAKVRDASEGDRCTTGFSVQHLGGGGTGVTTAAHCDGMDVYEEPWTGLTTEYDFQDQHTGLSGEVEWHTTRGMVDVPEYYADGDIGARREVDSVEATVAVNGTYCLYSHVGQNRTCDDVRSTLVTLFTNGLASGLIGMDDMNAEPGDSGGPWSFGTEAAGSVVGWYWNFGNHDCWSRAALYDDALGVEVLTR